MQGFETIRFTSFLGDNALDFYQQVAAYLGNVTGLPTEFVSDLSPTTRDQMVNEGHIHVVFTCGLPYVKKADCQPPLLRLMAAPVMAGLRYKNRPVYFSDVIVRAGSPYESFEALRGTTFAYNERYSLSGYMFPCYHLLTLGEADRFFAKTGCSGSHANSMDWVEDEQAGAAAIDSVVLDMEFAQRPERAKLFRVVERIGPAPMPPVAASTHLPDNVHQKLTQALLNLHQNEQGQTLLKKAGTQRFAPVVDADYDPIRHIIQALEEAGISELQ